jgi:hypothetical protein
VDENQVVRVGSLHRTIPDPEHVRLLKSLKPLSGDQYQEGPKNQEGIADEHPAAETLIFPDKEEAEDQHPERDRSIQETDKDCRRISQGEISQ